MRRDRSRAYFRSFVLRGAGNARHPYRRRPPSAGRFGRARL